MLGMGTTPLFDVDEGAFSEATREMLESGDFGFTFLNGKPRFDKPILVYWLQALSMSMFGLSEVGARMPSLVAGIASAWIAARFALIWSTRPESALIAFTLVCSCFGPLVMRHAATADALLYLWLTACSCCLIESIRLRESQDLSATSFASPNDSESADNTWSADPTASADSAWSARGYLRAAWICSALALLTKGLIGLLAPAFVVLGYCLVRLNLDALRWSFSDARACLAWIAVSLPWYAYAYWRFSNDFLQGLFGKHHFGRTMQAMEGHTGSWFYTLAMLFVLSLPFTPMLISSVWRLRSQSLASSDRLDKGLSTQALGLLSHSLGMLIVFSVVATKLPHYAMYALLPLLTLAALSPQISRTSWLSACAIGLLMLVAIAALHPILVFTIQNSSVNPFYRALIEHGLSHVSWGVTEQLILVICFGSLCFAIFSKSQLDRWLYFGLAMQMLVCFVLLPTLGQLLQGPIKALAKGARQEVTVSYQLRAPSISFYREAVTDDRLPQVDEQVILRVTDFPDLHRAVGGGAQWVLVDGAGPLLLLRRQ